MHEHRSAWPADPDLMDLPDVVYLEVGERVFRIRRRRLHLLAVLFLTLCAALGALSALAVWPAVMR